MKQFNISTYDASIIRDIVEVWNDRTFDEILVILRRILKDIHAGHLGALGCAISERATAIFVAQQTNSIYESQN